MSRPASTAAPVRRPGAAVWALNAGLFATLAALAEAFVHVGQAPIVTTRETVSLGLAIHLLLRIHDGRFGRWRTVTWLLLGLAGSWVTLCAIGATAPSDAGMIWAQVLAAYQFAFFLAAPPLLARIAPPEPDPRGAVFDLPPRRPTARSSRIRVKRMSHCDGAVGITNLCRVGTPKRTRSCGLELV